MLEVLLNENLEIFPDFISKMAFFAKTDQKEVSNRSSGNPHRTNEGNAMIPVRLDVEGQRLNMELDLQSLLGSMCKAVLIGP
jgi:hypothetical protein